MVAVAAFQVSVDDQEQPNERIDRVIAWVESLSDAVDLIVLPELWTVGAFNTHLVMGAAEDVDSGGFARRMAELAKKKAAWLHAGSFPEQHDNGVSNTSLIFDAEGNQRGSYRKIHLFGFDDGEAAAVVPGDRVVCLDTPLGFTGISTCYDLRFPELYRLQSATGAVALVVSSSWPAARIENWQLLTRARAVENQAVVVGCNTVGTHAGVQMGGHTMIVDATGTVLAEAGGTGEEVVITEIDLAAVQQTRADFPVLASRRLG